jgi:hypothetical protein
MKKEAVDQGKDRAVGADPERQRENGNQGECRLLELLAEREAEVGHREMK